MPKENENIKYLPGEKSAFIAYVDLECILKNAILSK